MLETIEISSHSGGYTLKIYENERGETAALLTADSRVDLRVPGQFPEPFDTDTGRAALIAACQAAADNFTPWPVCYSDGFDEPGDPDYMVYTCEFTYNSDGDYVCKNCGFIAHVWRSGWGCDTCGYSNCDLPAAPRPRR
jgi:hypothetical protein